MKLFDNTFIFFSSQGIWSPQKIPNPDYFEDNHPFLLTSFRALGLELWSMTSDIYFDNFIICSEKEIADRWAADGWGFKIMIANANEVWHYPQRGVGTIFRNKGDLILGMGYINGPFKGKQMCNNYQTPRKCT